MNLGRLANRVSASIVDDLVRGNRRYVETLWGPGEKELGARPAKRLAIVACMDTRYSVEQVLGLAHGDAKIIRNAGNRLDDGTLRSLIVAVHLLGVDTIVVMGHTKCGMTLVGRGGFHVAHSINERAGVPLHEVMRPDFQRWLGGFTDPEENVRVAMDLVRGHPYMPKDLQVYGMMYDNDSGMVRAVPG